MGANRHANGGLLLKDLLMPDFREYAVSASKPGKETAESTKVLGTFLRDVMKRNLEHANFRVFGPDETASNRLDAVYEATDKVWMEPICLPAVMGSSPAMRALSISWIRCSISMPSGSRPRWISHGGILSLRSIIF
jgi:xylulose-5-phosphate/fructose-6-phosphate phosphoketolase